MPAENEKPDVLSSLPRTRPQRRSARRDGPRKSAPAPRGEAAAGAEADAAAQAKPRASAEPRSPRRATAPAANARRRPARRPAAAPPRIPPAGFAPPREAERGGPSGTELVGTAIQAAGELVQIGAAIGGQALKSALGRLGRR